MSPDVARHVEVPGHERSV
jgi:hypothetical protein